MLMNMSLPKFDIYQGAEVINWFKSHTISWCRHFFQEIVLPDIYIYIYIYIYIHIYIYIYIYTYIYICKCIYTLPYEKLILGNSALANLQVKFSISIYLYFTICFTIYLLHIYRPIFTQFGLIMKNFLRWRFLTSVFFKFHFIST